MCYLIIFRTTSNISVEKIAFNDNTNYSEMAINDSFDQTEEIEPEKLLLKSSEPLLDMPIDDKLPNKETNHSLIDSFRKPCEKKITRRAQDKILDEIKKRTRGAIGGVKRNETTRIY